MDLDFEQRALILALLDAEIDRVTVVEEEVTWNYLQQLRRTRDRLEHEEEELLPGWVLPVLVVLFLLILWLCPGGRW